MKIPKAIVRRIDRFEHVLKRVGLLPLASALLLVVLVVGSVWLTRSLRVQVYASVIGLLAFIAGRFARDEATVALRRQVANLKAQLAAKDRPADQLAVLPTDVTTYIPAIGLHGEVERHG